MMMNWIFWAVLAFFAYHVIDGFRQGFIRKAVSMVSLILTLMLVTWLTPKITTLILENTSWRESLQEKCSEAFLKGDYNESVKTDQVLMIEEMDLPGNIKDRILENNNGEVYHLLQVTEFHEYVGAYLANMIISALAYLISFLVIWLLLRSILLALDVVASLPILHGINKLAGGVLGLAEAVILIWIAFLLVTVFCSGELGQQFFELIQENQLLRNLYDYNLIMKIVFGLIF